jgi:hypothetical protein
MATNVPDDKMAADFVDLETERLWVTHARKRADVIEFTHEAADAQPMHGVAAARVDPGERTAWFGIAHRRP